MRIPGGLFATRAKHLRQEVLTDLLDAFYRDGAFPGKVHFLIAHEAQTDLIEKLVEQQLIYDVNDQLELSIFGLFILETEKSRAIVQRCESALDALKERFRRNPSQEITVVALSEELGIEAKSLSCDLYYLTQLSIWQTMGGKPISSLNLKFDILRQKSFSEGFKEIHKLRFGGKFKFLKRKFSPSLNHSPWDSNRKSVWVRGKEFFGFWHTLFVLLLAVGSFFGIKSCNSKDEVHLPSPTVGGLSAPNGNPNSPK
ncbi:MAG: hypothetical protein KF767_11655 [Bdellovibrionaceae bacterium]|nr:hypothetical protein [Pseudobdellovibrionaceae bacterium]